MLFVDTCYIKFASLRCLEFILSKLYIRKECVYSILYHYFLFYRFLGLLGVFIVLPCTSYKLFEDTILQFKAHRTIIIDFRSQTFNEIGVIITRMELYKLNLFFLLISKQSVIIKIPVADNICGDFLCKIGFCRYRVHL